MEVKATVLISSTGLNPSSASQSRLKDETKHHAVSRLTAQCLIFLVQKITLNIFFNEKLFIKGFISYTPHTCYLY